MVSTLPHAVMFLCFTLVASAQVGARTGLSSLGATNELKVRATAQLIIQLQVEGSCCKLFPQIGQILLSHFRIVVPTHSEYFVGEEWPLHRTQQHLLL